MPFIALFEDAEFVNLLPLVYGRTVFELRCGRKTLLDRLARSLGQPVSALWTRDWLAAVATERLQLPVNVPAAEGTLLVNARALVPSRMTFQRPPFAGTRDGQIVYIACDAELGRRLRPEDLLSPERRAGLLERIPHAPVDVPMVNYLWDLVTHNAEHLAADWTGEDRGLEGRVSSSAVLIEPDSIHVGQRAVVEPTAVLDAQNGPIYVSEQSRIAPHAYVGGPAYIGPGSVVHPHSYIHGGTTLGAMCKVGGEIDNCIITGYSNKQHDGFLGHSYVGGWVNLGAGTANSDLKNTYGTVRVSLNAREVDTGLRFFGAVIGDHVKTGIGTMLPTGAVVGFGSMAACSRIVPKFVPSFSWLTDEGWAAADVERLLATARQVMQRRDVTCSPAEEALFREVSRRAPQCEGRVA